MSDACLALKARLSAGPTLVMPDAFDPLSARLIAEAGFEAVQCSGFSMAHASGYPAETNLSYSENLEMTRKIVNAVGLPVMADGEDGFGDRAKLRQAIREFIRIGVAGINIEDQVLGSWDGSKAVIPAETMMEKIRLVRKIAEDEGNPGLVINARSDILAVMPGDEGALAEAIRRGKLYLEAGADLFFPTGVKTLQEVLALREEVGRSVSIAAGLPYNIKAFGLSDLMQTEIARVSLPVIPLLASLRGMKSVLEQLAANGGFDSILADGHVDFGDLVRKSKE